MATNETRNVRDLRNEALYSANSIPNALEIYSSMLMADSENLKNISHAKTLKKYHDEIVNRKYLSRLRSNFNEIYALIDKNYDVRFFIEGRRKSLISTDEKIIKLLDEKRSLDLLRDTNGFRILLFGENSLDLVNNCYLIMEDIIKHFIEKGLTLCEAEPVKNTENFEVEKHPNIIIPKNPGISKAFSYGIKDYILSPKENGYQSIHAVFRSTNGSCFEVQVRTFNMHVNAESGTANHTKYKSKKYENMFSLDRNKIHIPGYGFSEDTLYDYIGLEKSLQILQRQKTF